MQVEAVVTVERRPVTEMHAHGDRRIRFRRMCGGGLQK